MTTFTKEQLQQIEAAAKEALWPVVWSEKKARAHFSEKITPEVVLELARIALLSLCTDTQAQPVSEPYKLAANDIIAERQRQISEEGWTPEHDDEHDKGELAMAAVYYINETGTVNRNGGKPWGWPWDASWWKPDTRRRNLVKAGALILAEIERIDRIAPAQESE